MARSTISSILGLPSPTSDISISPTPDNSISPTAGSSNHHLSTTRDAFSLNLSHSPSLNGNRGGGGGGGGGVSGGILNDNGIGGGNGNVIYGSRSDAGHGGAHGHAERAQSQGPDMSNTNNNGNHSSVNSNGSFPTPTTAGRKRQRSVDEVDHPKRRATIACEVCRSRKSRCDGSRPKCRLCIERNADCIYREPGIKLDAGDKLILEHLSRIENLLQNAALPSATPPSPSSVQMQDNAGSSPIVSMTRTETGLSNDDHQLAGLRTSSNTFSSMPKTHTTPALHLLQWPKISQLVSRPYSPQHLLQLELNRTPLQFNTSPTLDLSNAATATYVQAFFKRVNVWYACVNPYNWTCYYRTALSRGFRSSAEESCIVLLVLALGNASTRGSISRISPGEDPPGMSYFSAAWGMLPSLMTRTTIMSAQCMILTAAYLFYIVRPLEAWAVLNSTSMKLQLLLSTSSPALLPTAKREMSERVYWNALLFESDLLAELELPHSGIVQFEESVGLPCGFEEEDDEQLVVGGRDELWYFLAEIALRRLLNRVSHLIYSKEETSKSISSLAPIVAELDYQLTQWHENLPSPVQFSHNNRSGDIVSKNQNQVQTVLRLRYFACRTIIFRPYILAVLENESLCMTDNVVRENCRKCLEAATRQLEHITDHHAGHMPYLWQGALSMVSQSLLLMGATMSPSLASLLPHPEQMDMDMMFQEVTEEIERYSHLAPSLRLSAEIIREAEDRRKEYIRNSGRRV